MRSSSSASLSRSARDFPLFVGEYGPWPLRLQDLIRFDTGVLVEHYEA